MGGAVSIFRPRNESLKVCPSGPGAFLKILVALSFCPCIRLSKLACVDSDASQDLVLSVNVRWPGFFYFFVRWLRILDTDVLLAQPHCFLGNTPSTWHKSYVARAALPWTVYGGLFVLAILFHCISRRFRRAFWRGISVFAMWYIVPQMNVFLDSLNCVCVVKGYELDSISWGNCSAPGARRAVRADAYTPCTGQVGFCLPLSPLPEGIAYSSTMWREMSFLFAHMLCKEQVSFGLSVSSFALFCGKLQRYWARSMSRSKS